MRRKMLCEMPALALLSLSQFLFHAAEPCVAAGELPKKESAQSAETAPADRKDSLRLGFSLTKDSEGRVWAHFYIHNRGKTGLLICDAMELSFSASTADSKDDFPLYYASHDFHPLVFFLVDAPPPGRSMSGVTSVSRRVEVRSIYLTQLAGLRELFPETMKKAKIVGRVEGSVLKWDIATGEYVKKPFHLSSVPHPWERFSQLFTAPISSQEDSLEEFDPLPNGEGERTKGESYGGGVAPGNCAERNPK